MYFTFSVIHALVYIHILLSFMNITSWRLSLQPYYKNINGVVMFQRFSMRFFIYRPIVETRRLLKSMK